jgi:hypothetical protein
MTIQEMHTEFRLAFDKLESSAYPDYQVEEVDYLLNEAIIRFVKTRYSPNNLYRKGFEEIQKRIDDIRSLVKTAFCATIATGIEPNVYKANPQVMFTDEAQTSPINPNDRYMFYLRGRSRNVKTGCPSVYKWVRLVQHDDLDYLMDDPFNKPYYGRALAYFEDNVIYVATDGNYSIDNFKLTYLKWPIKVQYGSVYPSPVADVDSDLPEHTHKEIIQIAVSIALENIESPRQQSQEMNLNRME